MACTATGAHVEVAVGLWARKFYATGVFDRDDARQEAGIAIWQAGEKASSTVGYRQIIDAIRSLTPGFRKHAPLFVRPFEQRDEDIDPPFERAIKRRDEDIELLTPEDIAAARQVRERMSQALPPDTRRAVDLCLSGMSYEEIGKAMGCSAGAINQRILTAHRWIERLRKKEARHEARHHFCT